MKIDYFQPEYEIVRNDARCVRCRLCERQCAFGVHSFDEKHNIMLADESKCAVCHRCAVVCPTRAIKIVRSGNCFKPNPNFTESLIRASRNGRRASLVHGYAQGLPGLLG